MYDHFMVKLPVDVIENWLNRSRNSNAKGQMENERVLSIEITGGGVSLGNISEMVNCLKKVNFNHLILIIWVHKIEKFLFLLLLFWPF